MSYNLNKWVENERRSRPRSRYLRLVLAALMIATAALALDQVFDQSDRGKLADLGIPLILLTLAMVNSPFGRTRFAGYDEFEQKVVVRATFHAFNLLLGLVLIFFLWLWIASSNGWPVPHTPVDWSAVGFGFLAIGGGLPVLMAELMVPMPPQGEADEEQA